MAGFQMQKGEKPMSNRTVPEWVDHILGSLNIIDLIEGQIMGILYGDVTPHRISIPHPEGDFWETWQGAFWNGRMTAKIVKERGVRVYWWGFNGSEVYFHVANRQARWAEYILLRGGVPIQTTFDHRNAGWAAQHTDLPPSWKQQAADEKRRRKATNRRSLWARIKREIS